MYIPEDLKYTREHDWARIEGNRVVVGITDYAQEELGDIVYVELPEVGSEVEHMEPFGTIESVKAVSDLFSPVSGEVVEINETLESEPELVNSDPYGEGWMLVVEMSDASELDSLMSAAEYAAYIEKERAKEEDEEEDEEEEEEDEEDEEEEF
ncbi:MAG: glycine cleavage system protein GcvH [Candidatus Tectomicrobia bacterium]|uniref:Glycine cleavage system H protein n=1 Tax=Tectimicrobiota bacterium TaxID=2528274 RepID=A0A932CLW3_UNCTE|nr:glycine cleavage system protein GcvH [Candidatus Tectomicrobia bacterium]